MLSDRTLLQSSCWRTTPVDCPPGSPLFLNAMAGLVPRAEETPETLLITLQQLEKEFGRALKKTFNEPRPLDLDLIAFGRRLRATPQLTLPHPRAHLRAFVLAPLNEIATGATEFTLLACKASAMRPPQPLDDDELGTPDCICTI